CGYRGCAQALEEARTRPPVIGPRASGKRTWNYDSNRFQFTKFGALSHAPVRKTVFRRRYSPPLSRQPTSHRRKRRECPKNQICNWAAQDAYNSAYRPGWATSAACGPRWTRRPWSKTRTSSAASAVESRWAIETAVRPRVMLSMAR